MVQVLTEWVSVSAGLERKREETATRQSESRANISRLKVQVEQAAAQLEKDKQAFQQKQVRNSRLSQY